MFERIRGEFDRTSGLICSALGTSQALEHEPVLKRSILLRNPYIDPMSLIQLDLLKRWRDGGREDQRLERALKSTVKGIARGLQNTG